MAFENIDAIVEFIGMGAAVFLVYKVTEQIIKSNLPQLFMRALKNGKQELYKKAIGKVVEFFVKNNNGSEISLDVLESEGFDLKDKQIKISSSAGVSSELKNGKKLTFVFREC